MIDIGINFLTASIGNFLAWDIALIYIVSLIMVGILGSAFCEWCWKLGGVPRNLKGVPSNA